MKRIKYTVKYNEDMTKATIKDLEFVVRTFDDYKEEFIDGGNECAFVFHHNTYIDQNNNEFVLWGDEETEEHFITYLPKYYEVK